MSQINWRHTASSVEVSSDGWLCVWTLLTIFIGGDRIDDLLLVASRVLDLLTDDGSWTVIAIGGAWRSRHRKVISVPQQFGATSNVSVTRLRAGSDFYRCQALDVSGYRSSVKTCPWLNTVLCFRVRLCLTSVHLWTIGYLTVSLCKYFSDKGVVSNK